MPKLINKGNTVLFIVLIAILMASAIGVIYYYQQTRKSSDVALQTQNAKQIDISDWQTYKDSLGGYQISYPKDWQGPTGKNMLQNISDVRINKSIEGVIYGDVNIYFSKTYLLDKNKGFSEIVADQRKDLKSDPGTYTNLKEDAIVIGGKKAIKFFYDEKRAPLDPVTYQPNYDAANIIYTEQIFIEGKDNSVYIIDWTSMRGREDETYIPISKKIISTFQFVE